MVVADLHMNFLLQVIYKHEPLELWVTMIDANGTKQRENYASNLTN